MTPSKATARMTPTAPAPDQTPASEVTPVEAAAEAIRNLVADDAEIQAAEVARALLAGDWLEDVIEDALNAEGPDLSGSDLYRATRRAAAAIRAAAGATR